MKKALKLVLLIVILSFALMFVGCTNSLDNEAQSETQAEVENDVTNEEDNQDTSNDERHYLAQLDPEYSVASDEVTISLNEFEDFLQVESVLGEPRSTVLYERRTANSDIVTNTRTYNYDGLELRFTNYNYYQQGTHYWLQQIIIGPTMVGPKYQTARGIRIYDSLERLQEVYPELTQFPDGRTDPDNSAWKFTIEESFPSYIIFEIEGGTISEIKFETILP